jgi:uncharacterized membrane protein
MSILASVTYAGDPTTLTNGVAVTGLSGAAASEQFYKIDIPAGQDTLEISTSGGTGDVDLYVRKGSLPTTTSYDYRPYKVGNNETVDVNNPAAATWYIMLKGYSSYSGVTLKATYSATVSVKSLTTGVAATGLTGAANAELYYSIDVPAGQTKLTIAMSGGTGDADLYVKKDSLPTTTSYDYRPFLAGNNETVSVDTPAAGTWYIMVRGYSAFAGITLLASLTGASTGTALDDGVAVTNLSGAASSEKTYRIDLPTGVKTLLIEMSGGTGDADLYVKLKSPPTATDYDYRPFQTGNNETVTVDAPAAGTWFVMIRGYSDYAGVTLKASWGNVTVLQNNVPVKGLSGALDSETFYRIDVPAGQTNLEFVMSGGTGNADMYIKQGAKPTTSLWDYRPTTSGNTESINISSDMLAGTWYVMLKGTKAYDSVTLEADYSAVETVVALANGVPVTNLSGIAGTQLFFSIDVPAGQTKFEIRISGGTGDADLYVRLGSKPTPSTYDYKPNLVGNDEGATIDNPAAGTWYIMVRGHAAFSGVTLLATYGGPAPETITTLQNGVAVTGLKGATGSQTFFKIAVPAGQVKLDIVMSGGTGDADLYVHKGSKPTTSDYDYRPYLSGNNESVSIDNPAADTWYIMLNGYAAFDGVTLKATYTPMPDQVTALTNGVPVTGLSGASASEKFYKIDVPAGQDYLTIETSGGTGDVDLYVKKGAKPTVSSWDYRPYLVGNNEKVSVTSPAAATWYILLRGYQAYSGLTLTAAYGVNTPITGNNFATDPNCVALWRFESSKLTTDSVGTNTLQNHGVTANTTDKMEATSSAELTAVEKDYLWIANASLSSKFPFSSASAPKAITVAFWMKLNSLPTAGLTFDPFSKVDDVKGLSTFTTMVGPGGEIGFFIGTSDSRKYEDAWTLPIVLPGKWYHVVVSYRDTDKSYRINVWSEDTGTVIADKTGNLTNNIVVTDADVYLGARQGLPANRFLDGLLDEMAVFNDALAPDDIAKIRAATYGKTH